MIFGRLSTHAHFKKLEQLLSATSSSPPPAAAAASCCADLAGLMGGQGGGCLPPQSQGSICEPELEEDCCILT